MVAAGLGIAMVPRLAVASHRPDVKAVPFSAADEVPTRSIYVATLARRAYSPAMHAVAEALRTAADTIQETWSDGSRSPVRA
jgi:DNA-binding transcriptional LysR family regulator